MLFSIGPKYERNMMFLQKLLDIKVQFIYFYFIQANC